MTQTHFTKLFQYEAWANKTLLEALNEVDQPPARAEELFAHILAAQKVWLERLQNLSAKTKPWEPYVQSDLASILDENTGIINDFLEGLKDEELSKILTYQNTKGVTCHTSISDILTHLALHSAHHRGNIMTLIKPLIDDLPWVDYLAYLRTL